jgi:hypothetical protein
MKTFSKKKKTKKYKPLGKKVEVYEGLFLSWGSFFIVDIVVVLNE